MKVGIALNMLCQQGRSDASVVGEHLAMGDLAEPLGFDSIFARKHARWRPRAGTRRARRSF